jgi:hypothetical protein
MMRTPTMISVILLMLPPAAAQQRPTPDQMKAMAEKTRPGPAHRELAALEGEWTQEITYSMGTPTPLKARGTTRNRMILGGRFLVSERTSQAAPGTTMPGLDIDAMSIYGFDRRTNQYTIIELDTTGTYWVSAAGGPAADKIIVMSGESLDDHGGVREMRKFDMVLQVMDTDTYVTRIVFKFDGRPPTTLVEAVHRRVK